MKDLPKKYRTTKERQAMWDEAKNILEKVDDALDCKEMYAIGSAVSNKKNPSDIDFVLVAKVKKKQSNTAWPVDLIIVPENEDTKDYLDFFTKYMKKKYGSTAKPVKLK